LKLNKAEFKFLITFIPLITAWFFTYHYIYKIDELLNLDTDLLTKFSELLSYQSNFILSIFNFDTSTEIHGDIVISKILNFTDSHGVWIGEPCNGIKIFGLFSIFIISFKGELKRKILYISFGILVLHLLNILRISILTYISAINPFLLDFNHNVTFQLIIYGAMLCLWYIWITKFSLKKAA
jgi:exosortase family protein XrtF